MVLSQLSKLLKAIQLVNVNLILNQGISEYKLFISIYCSFYITIAVPYGARISFTEIKSHLKFTCLN